MKGYRVARAAHTFSVTNPKLFIQIRCKEKSKRNCSKKINPTNIIQLTAQCTGLVCTARLTYTWTVYQLSSTSKHWRAVSLKNTIVDGDTITFQAGKLKEGTMYKAILVVESSALRIKQQYTKQITTNLRPKGGRCFADRYSGLALRTTFKFNCTGWMDDPEDLPLTYEFGYKTSKGIANVLQISERSSAESKLGLGDPSRNFSLKIIIRIKDKHGFYAELNFTVQVQQKALANATQTLMEYAVGDKSDVGTLLNQGNVKEATQLASAVLSVLSSNADNALKQEEKIKIKDSVIQHMARVNVSDNIETLIQVASVVAGVTENKEELSQDSQEKSVNVLESMTSAFKEIAEEKKSDHNNRMKAGNNLLHGIGNVLTSSSFRAKVTEENEMQTKNKTKILIKEKNKDTVKTAFKLITVVAESLLSNTKLNDEPIVIETKALNVVLVRKIPKNIGNRTVNVGDCEVDLPPSSILLGNLKENSSFIDTQMIKINSNPFTWHQSAQVIKSPVISIDIKDDGGRFLNVSHLSKEIEIKMPTPSRVKVKKVSHFTNSTGMAYHHFHISSEALTVYVRIVPEDGKHLQIYLAHNRRPTNMIYSYKAFVPDFSSCNMETKEGNYRNCTSDPFLLKFTSNVTGHLGLHFLGVKKSTTNDNLILSRRRRSPCSGSGRQKRAIICNEFKEPPTTEAPTPFILKPLYNSATDVNYTISVSMATCQYWNEIKERWTSEGCRVGPRSKPGSLQCLCNHLSSFGGDFFVAPNPIDFDKVFLEFTRLGETGNVVVLSTICVILGIYLLAAVFARREDNSDKEKMTEVIPLGRCSQDSSYVLEITVYTGIWRRCGTTANVAITLHGEDRDSDIMPLACNAMCAKKLFQRGSINTFVLPLVKELGDLTHIKIWHDNSGKSPSWFLRQILIRDKKKNKKWTFVNNRWLAVEKDDGKIERVLYVASDGEINSFKNKLITRTANGLGDGHIWLSVMTRPPSSHFTRLQRLSCCLSVFMSAMIANAMFYKFGAEAVNTFNLGPLVMSWQQIITGIQSSLIVVPINLLIVSIFRNVKPKLNSSESEHIYNVNDDIPNKKNKKGFLFPQWCLYIAWTLCLATSFTSAAFTVFYSMMWGKETSNQWFTSLLVSFSQDVVVIQPIKVILVACLLALILKKAPDEEHFSNAGYDGITSSKVRGESSKPVKPKSEELRKFREYRVRVLAMARILLEVFFYLMFAWMLLVVVYGYRDVNRYYLTKNVEELLPRFKKVKNIKTFWNWTETTMIPNLYKTIWYNGQQFEYKEGFVSNRKTYIVGMPRLRQLRVKEGACPIGSRHPDLTSNESDCQPQYSFLTQDTTTFNRPGWIPFEVNGSSFLSEFELYQICPRPWQYRDYIDLNTLPFQGVQALYSGGGYVADLGYTSGAAMRVVQNLKENNWIDTRTRAVFLEVFVHEPATKLFSAVTHLVEFLPMGNAITYHKVTTMALYGATASGFQFLYAFCELLLILTVIYFILSECVKLYGLRLKYFKSAWTYVELTQIVCAVLTIILSIFRRYYTSQLVSRVHENPFKTTSFHYVVFWSELETILIALLVFVITVKLLNILKFNEHISALASSMKNSFNSIISYSIVFLVIFFAFAQVAHLVFGPTVQSYSSMLETMRAQFSMFIGGPINYDELKSSNRILGPLFYFAFITSMTMILVNMFLAILNEGYHDVKLFPEMFSEDHKMVMFFKDYAKRRLRDVFLDLKSTKLFPKCGKYEVRYQKTDFNPTYSGSYKSLQPLQRQSSDAFDEIPSNTEEDDTTFLSGLKESLRDIRNELSKFRATKRSKKYKVQKEFDLQMSFRKEGYKNFCVGLFYKPKLRNVSKTDESNKKVYSDESEQLLKTEKTSSDEEADETTNLKCDKETII